MDWQFLNTKYQGWREVVKGYFSLEFPQFF
jgi:hypothetical protein